MQQHLSACCVLLLPGWRSPQLSQLLVYLAHLFSEYSSSSHGSSRGASVQVQQLLQAPGADLAKSVLLEGRDESPLPPDISGMRIGERDVQVWVCSWGNIKRRKFSLAGVVFTCLFPVKTASTVHSVGV